MKRPLYYLLCVIACTSMVSATMPMAAIAEAIQPQATAGQQAQADATASDTGKAEDGSNTNVPAANTATSNSTDTPANTTQTAPVDANTAGAAATPNTTAATSNTATPGTIAATTTPPIPPRPNQPHACRNPHHVTNRLRPLRNRKPKRRHLHRLVERRPRGHRDDLPRNPDQRLVPGQGAHGRAHLWDGGSQESVCDPSRQAWASYYSLRARARDRAQRIHVGPQFTCMELAKVPIPNQKW